jgi:hypothetical protein
MKIGEKHRLSFESRGSVVTFDGVILGLEEGLISFEDKFGDIWTFSKEKLISSKQLNGSEKNDKDTS